MTAPTTGPGLEVLAPPVVVPPRAPDRPPVVVHAPAATLPFDDVTRPLRPGYLPGAVLTTLGMLAAALVAVVAVLGPVRHARDQSTAYDRLRAELADGVAPVNQIDESGALLPLGTPLGIIDIPQLGVREVFLEGTTSGVLRSGPGHRRDTPLPGQAGTSVIMGRAAGFGGPFSALGQLTPGTVFTVTSGLGERIPYRVTGVRRQGDPLPPPLAPGKGRLSLITATGTAFVPDGVLVVDADLVGPARASGPRPLRTALLPPSERPLQGEPTAWIPAIALGQLLLLAAVGVAWFRYRWGRWQVWLTGGPVLVALTLAVADQVARLLPNLL